MCNLAKVYWFWINRTPDARNWKFICTQDWSSKRTNQIVLSFAFHKLQRNATILSKHSSILFECNFNRTKLVVMCVPQTILLSVLRVWLIVYMIDITTNGKKNWIDCFHSVVKIVWCVVWPRAVRFIYGYLNFLSYSLALTFQPIHEIHFHCFRPRWHTIHFPFSFFNSALPLPFWLGRHAHSI